VSLVKNPSVVHHVVDYDRLESDEKYALLEHILAHLHLYGNFFQLVFNFFSILSTKSFANMLLSECLINILWNEKRLLCQQRHACSICINTSIWLNYLAA